MKYLLMTAAWLTAAAASLNCPAGQTGDKQTGLPESYSCLEEGMTLPVREQGSYGTCWALAAVTALEASWQKQHPEEAPLRFSADHMALNNGFTTELSDGGDPVMVMAYLSGWKGPVKEEEDPYGDGVSPDGLTAAIHVKEIRLMENASPEEVKEAVFRYGAVQTSLYMTRETVREENGSYSPEAAAYRYPQAETPCHEVAVIGWDDAYPAEAFPSRPERDGAYLCRNSWGSDFGFGGDFYVSYEDPNIASTVLVFTRTEPAETDCGRLLQTDDCGWQGQQGYAEESCFLANVYTAPQQEASLTGAGIYAVGPNTGYELYVVHNWSGTEDFDRRELICKGTLPEEGYYAIEADSPVLLNGGERFAVVCRVTVPGEDHPAAVEYAAMPYAAAVSLEGKEGYLSRNGDAWEQTEKKFGSNVCLKAYLRKR